MNMLGMFEANHGGQCNLEGAGFRVPGNEIRDTAGARTPGENVYLPPSQKMPFQCLQESTELTLKQKGILYAFVLRKDLQSLTAESFSPAVLNPKTTLDH